MTVRASGLAAPAVALCTVMAIVGLTLHSHLSHLTQTLEDLDHELGLTRADLASARRELSERIARTDDRLVSSLAGIRDAGGSSGEPAAADVGRRSLQQEPGGAGGSAECLAPGDVAVAAIDLAYSANEGLAAFMNQTAHLLADKADSLEAEAAAASLFVAGCAATETSPPTVCEPPADGLVATGCTVLSGTGSCTAAAHTCSTAPERCPLTTAFATLDATVALKASAVDHDALAAAVDQKADLSTLQALAAQVGAQVSEDAEGTPCRCAECADQPQGAELCAPFSSAVPCACVDTSGSTDPLRVAHPVTQSSPPCCRPEWLESETITQTSTLAPQVYSTDEVVLQVGGTVTVEWSGWENIQQVADFSSFTAVEDGIFSGDPTNSGSFSHTFDSAGEYMLWSQVHETLRFRVTVHDCVSCVVVAGYDGSDLASLALAMSHRAAGEYTLHVSGDYWAGSFMTFLTAHPGQTLVLSGAAAPVGQLPMVPATITALSGSEIVVNSTHVSGGITLEEGARYRNTPCGDEVVDDWRGEECDAGSENADGPDAACRIDCTLPRCGDGIHDSGEGCDGGSANADVPDAACRTDCTLPRCGDGVQDSGEGCDGGSANADVPDAACRSDCTVARCGDGVHDSAEGCDAGESNAADGTCSLECVVQILCPSLAALEGATISYSNGNISPSVATYTCDATGNPPINGDATRTCQADGSWSGVGPTSCCAASTQSRCCWPSRSIGTQCGMDAQIAGYSNAQSLDECLSRCEAHAECAAIVWRGAGTICYLGASASGIWGPYSDAYCLNCN